MKLLRLIGCIALALTIFGGANGLLNPTLATSSEASLGGSRSPVALDLRAEMDTQFRDLQEQLAQRDRFKPIADQVFRKEALILDSDRDPADIVLRRSLALLNDLQATSGDTRLQAAREKLEALRAKNRRVDVTDTGARENLYRDACELRREIAFANPLLDFDRILFIKRNMADFFHMCDQYYGFFANAGGGLYALENPFGAEPNLVDLLSDSVVQNGRLAGAKLEPGSFVSPELSYDGKTIYFAYSQTQEKGENWSREIDTDAYVERCWTPEKSYHIFKVDLDGSSLVQLTDGDWNDFDPCCLPDGRIAFVSERRGGYLRCGGRPCPTYTLHGMNPDGSDIVCLSYHETHEWHPSVNHDGMLVYTRWDYVDRDTNVAHHPWVTTPDGRDARAIHGNYPTQRGVRPWMEMDIRAIPGSHRYVSTAAGHHGQAYGSLVIVDPAVEDDDAMAPVKRITPEVAFPEAEGGKKNIRGLHAFATAWPLSEDYYLCAYDYRAKNHGIYIVDSFGNRELLYRGDDTPCLGPIPLRPRPVPPVVPHRTAEGFSPMADAAPNATAEGTETVTVINVYDSRLEWPEDTRITALRVIQVLPKTTPSVDQPRIGIARQTNARAVLGTVPVEADGSAYFYAPAHKPIYFQALDERGMAIQSMRSVTYLHRGEKLTCQGCHERRNSAAPRPANSVVAALQREPSTIQPEAEGSNPFSYPRLVQPVLNEHCVNCHEKEEDAPNLSGGDTGFYPSYAYLAPKYGFFFNSFNGSFEDPSPIGGARTEPGNFGARTSKLLAYLQGEHHDVKLNDEDLRRITLWLDCNSDFYGSYENIEAQSRGEVVWPTLE